MFNKKHIIITFLVLTLGLMTGCRRSVISENQPPTDNQTITTEAVTIEIQSTDMDSAITTEATTTEIQSTTEDEKVYGGKIHVQHFGWYTLFDVPTKYVIEHVLPDVYEPDMYGYRGLENTGDLSFHTDNYLYGETGESVYITFGEIGADEAEKKARILQASAERRRENFSDTDYEATDAVIETINDKTVVYFMEKNFPDYGTSTVTGYMYFSQEQLDKWNEEGKSQFFITISYDNYNEDVSFESLYSAFVEIVNSYDGNYYHDYGQEDADYTIVK